MNILPEVDRNQVINHKPEKGRLPEALVRTFSVKSFKDTVSSLGLYRRILASPTVGDATVAATQVASERTVGSVNNK